MSTAAEETDLTGKPSTVDTTNKEENKPKKHKKKKSKKVHIHSKHTVLVHVPDAGESGAVAAGNTVPKKKPGFWARLFGWGKKTKVEDEAPDAVHALAAANAVANSAGHGDHDSIISKKSAGKSGDGDSDADPGSHKKGG